MNSFRPVDPGQEILFLRDTRTKKRVTKSPFGHPQTSFSETSFNRICNPVVCLYSGRLQICRYEKICRYEIPFGLSSVVRLPVAVPSGLLTQPLTVRDTDLLQIRIHSLPVCHCRDDSEIDDLIPHLAEMLV